MLDKSQQLNKLTWKYFWQQKLTEIGLGLIIAVGGIFVPYYAGMLFDDLFGVKTEGIFVVWIFGVFILLLIFLILAILLVIVLCWITSNWEKAKKRAKAKLKKEGKNG